MLLVNKNYLYIIQTEMFNKFFIFNINNLPLLKKVILSFLFKKPKFNDLVKSFFALELIAGQKSLKIKSKKDLIFIKVKKGNAIGCKIELRKKNKYIFLNNFLDNYILNIKLKNNKIFYSSTNPIIKVKDATFLKEIENRYKLFKNLYNLSFTFVFKCNCLKESFYLTKSLKFI